MYDWSGTVPARAEQGQSTELFLKAGDVISIIAKGWVQYGGPGDPWTAPQGVVDGNNDEYSLVAKIGDKTYEIGNGVLHKTIPVDGELVFLFNDYAGDFGDNTGDFHVDVKVESRYSPDYLKEIKPIN
ncbi:LecA/PA-IL family lectin [Xenorhabdus bovienii]|uniref:PA-I galactophilic lectin (PA-IL) (Galactose-binding lectin) n=1 Tax=Xenorhabdus bovienii str. Intermedium TaxID=1379677 RepID=A0A077QFD7_XENBV|nr:LecA/PA-IL family lectin [Xenorhabdus bovienii]MDE9456014.1 LecA/PA-IL family lectin [Xenorhabdus bovienii]MDE9566470.1 LecA/PA-IL family lectin [Xenorhabdus bovienii]CDH31760.1 PA-I galactophilic lectin (PA-IL) (Galactose-binding lectin) [Xenorhabdus bovienii str. Intermedium]